MPVRYKDYTEALKKSVKVGKSAARSVSEILIDEEMLKCIEEHNLRVCDETSLKEVGNATSNVNKKRTSYKGFFRGITRELNKLVDTFADHDPPGFLKTIERGERGFGTARFYWASEDIRNEAISGEAISDKRAEARVFALRFISTNFGRFLPPSLVTELKADINESYFYKRQFKGLEDKLQFWPAHIEQGNEGSVENRSHWREIFDALLNNRPFRATYESTHDDVIPKSVTLSPQRIQYINHDVKLLAYIHERNIHYSFQLDQIEDFQFTDEVSFHSIRWDKFEHYYDFEFRGADWAINYLCRIGFGTNINVSSNGGGTSKIAGRVLIPNHFNKKAPDAFDCVNFLSGFGDALQVLKPDFIRAEFKRRAKAMLSLYENDDIQNSIPILLKSPHEQTSNELMLGKYDKRYAD